MGVIITIIIIIVIAAKVIPLIIDGMADKVEREAEEIKAQQLKEELAQKSNSSEGQITYANLNNEQKEALEYAEEGMRIHAYNGYVPQWLLIDIHQALVVLDFTVAQSENFINSIIYKYDLSMDSEYENYRIPSTLGIKQKAHAMWKTMDAAYKSGMLKEGRIKILVESFPGTTYKEAEGLVAKYEEYSKNNIDYENNE